jgi:hypothetical protein
MIYEEDDAIVGIAEFDQSLMEALDDLRKCEGFLLITTNRLSEEEKEKTGTESEEDPLGLKVMLMVSPDQAPGFGQSALHAVFKLVQLSADAKNLFDGGDEEEEEA